MIAIIQDVLYPLMSYSEADEELWNTDPHEYIRIKFGEQYDQNIFTCIITLLSLLTLVLFLFYY